MHTQMCRMLTKLTQQLLWAGKAFGIPFRQKLRVLIGPSGRWEQQHAIDRKAESTELRDEFSSL